MPLSRPSLADLVQRVAADIASRLPGADALLRRSNLGVLGKVLAGVAHGLYGFLAYIARQVIIDTADADYLERWAVIWGLVRHAAVAAGGTVTFTGVNGTAIPAGTVLQRSDGTQFTTNAPGVIASGSAAIAVTASDPGTDGETAAGSVLVMSAPIAGVASSATVAAGGLSGGSDVESDAALRARLLLRIRRPPQGGSRSDYENWTLEVPGVTRVWVRPLYLGLGTVGILFVRDDDPSIIPDVGEVATVAAYLEERRPVTAELYVLAPTPVALAFTIELTPDTADVRAAVIAELTDVLRREAEPGGTILRSHLTEAISLAAGEVDHVLTVPAADVEHDATEMAVMGVVTWV